MQLNHLDLQVADVQHTVAVFEELFGLRLESSPTSSAIAILSDGAGFTLVLQRKKRPEERYPSDFHIGFLVDSIDIVYAVHARAATLHLEAGDVVRNNRGTMVYIAMPDGYLVEVSCRPSAP